MKTKLLTIIITALSFCAIAQNVRVDTNYVIAYPTNFWDVNASNALREFNRRGVATNAASPGKDGWLSSNDYNTFSAKQPALGYSPVGSNYNGIVGALGYAPQPSNNNVTGWSLLSTNGFPNTGYLGSVELRNPSNQFNGSSVSGLTVTASNVYVGGNPAFTLTTNIVVVYGAGSAAANGQYGRLTSVLFTNEQTSAIQTFQNPTWFIQLGGTNLYSASTNVGAAWAIVNGATNAPYTTWGYYFDGTGVNFQGKPVGTNFQALVATNDPRALSFTNTGNFFSGTFSGTVVGSQYYSTNVLYASQWGVPMDGVTSVVPYIQRMADQCSNAPVVVFLDGPRFKWDSGKAVQLRSNVMVTAGVMGTVLTMGTNNNCPFFQNNLNTNYLSLNIWIDNLFMDQQGTNQATMMYQAGNPLNGTCAASGTNIYTTAVVFAGVSNLAITRVELRNPTSYGLLISCADSVLLADMFINYLMRSQCGGDGYHFWGAVNNVRMLRCRLNAHEGDGIAINLSETSQLGRSQFWSTNSNYCHNFVVDDFELTCPPGPYTGSTFMNIQCGDDAWSHMDNMRISNVRIDKCAVVFRRVESCRTLSVENCQVGVISQNGATGFGDLSSVQNLTLKNIRFTIDTNVSELSPPLAILLGSGQVLVEGVVANIQSISASGHTLFGVSGQTNTIVVSGVNLLGGAGVFQNMDFGNAEIRYSASKAPGIPVVYDNSGSLGAPMLTNVFGDSAGPRFFPTNFVDGVVYTMWIPEGATVRGFGMATNASTTGNVQMDLVINGVTVDSYANQTSAETPYRTNTFKLEGVVEYLQQFYWTNRSVGGTNATRLLNNGRSGLTPGN